MSLDPIEQTIETPPVPEAYATDEGSEPNKKMVANDDEQAHEQEADVTQDATETEAPFTASSSRRPLQAVDKNLNSTSSNNTINNNNNNSNQENIKVAVRLRPFTEKEKVRQSKRIVDIEQNTIVLYNPKARANDDSAIKKFTFDYSYWSHDGFKRNPESGVNEPDPQAPNYAKYVGQERVFNDLGRFLLENALEGYNSALLAYGQTGSGKSYTVSGYGQNEGILPRFARELFAELDRRMQSASVSTTITVHDDDSSAPSPGADKEEKSSKPKDEEEEERSREDEKEETQTTSKPNKNRYEVYFSMIEIYNEVVRDLLAKQTTSDGSNQQNNYNYHHHHHQTTTTASRRGLRVREHPKRGFFVEALTSIACADKEEIERLIEEGQLNKSIAATSMNETSSRGHTIYEFHIRQYKSKVPVAPELPKADADKQAPTVETETLTTSVVQLVDLAGSERMAAIGFSGNGNSDTGTGTRSGSPLPGAGAGSSSGMQSGEAQLSKSRMAPVGRRRVPNSAASVSSSTTSSTTTTISGGPKTSSLRRSNQVPASPQNNTLAPLNLMLGNHQQRFKESVSINQSLSALGNCIQVLSQYSQQQQQLSEEPAAAGAGVSKQQQQQPKIPYRDSVLTKLLNRCCLSGNSKVVLIATLSPADTNYDDTLSTLRFADRAKQIRTHALINSSSRAPTGAAVNALQRENERLKQMLDGRVTRSDDSSQTSNFDDTENMQDNFNGPKPAEIPSRATAAAAAAANAGNATITRGRVATRKTLAGGPLTSSNSQVAAASRARAKSTLSRTAQDKLATPQKKPLDTSRAGSSSALDKMADTPTKRAAGRTSGRGGGGEQAQSTSRIPKGKKAGDQSLAKVPAVSNPSLAATSATTAHDSEQMKQLVSSGRRKMRQNTQTLEEARDARGDGDNLRKSRSVGQGLAAGNARRTTSVDVDDDDEDGEQLAAVDNEVEPTAAGLLDEIDLNELASIIDDENLLSLGSSDEGEGDGSTTPSRRAKSRQRLLEEGHLTNEEKMDILNKILSKSNGAGGSNGSNKAGGGIIKQKLEENLKAAAAAAAPTGTADARTIRPKKTRTGGTKQQELQRSTSREATSGSASNLNASSAAAPRTSQLKKTNPYLSNLNPDEQLTGMITYIIRPGEMIVGKSSACDLPIYGPGLRGRHARIVRISGETPNGQVLIEPIFDESKDKSTTMTRRAALMLNGEPVLERTKLSHGDRLLFGSTNYFVFIDDATAAATAASTSAQQSPSKESSGTTGGSLDMVTYDMAHQEVLRKIMSNSENEAMIREINGYTHRPGTGKHRAPAAATAAETGPTSFEKSRAHNSRLTRSMTIHDDNADGTGAPGELRASYSSSSANQLNSPSSAKDGTGSAGAGASNSSDNKQQQPLDKIKEEQEPLAQVTQPDDDKYRGKLMDDTYEFAMPIAEANAIAKEMGIKVTYGLKILTGEEQLLLMPDEGDGDELVGDQVLSPTSSSSQPDVNSRDFSGTSSSESVPESSTYVVSRGREIIRPETLDIPPELYVHVHLDELDADFYWTKEKFQERRVKMLELYGAWDVGGKSGLVEYLIEQSKYQGYYMIDPFIDDLRSAHVLIGHAQVTLQPVAHMSRLRESFDILDVNDEVVGQLKVEATPCVDDDDHAMNYHINHHQPRVLSDQELAKSFIENPGQQLLNKPLVFLLQIASCSNVPDKFARIFCQYTLNRDQEQQQQPQPQPQVIRTKVARISDDDQQSEITFNHSHLIAIDKVTPDVLDFFLQGFLTIQLVGQYKLKLLQRRPGPTSAGSSGNGAQSSISSSAGGRSSSTTSTTQPTLISTIISSINKYRFRMEQQAAANNSRMNGGGGPLSGEPPGGGGGAGMNRFNGSIYANSLTDSAKSGNGYGGPMMGSSGIMNSGASSVTSASAATINLFDQQQDDDGLEGSASLSGTPTQENIIDIILTKRKLDRAENQLHYIKRTIGLAEHYNKKHIPVRTVKRLLNASYGPDMDGGSLEEIGAEVTSETKSTPGKSSNCLIQ